MGWLLRILVPLECCISNYLLSGKDQYMQMRLNIIGTDSHILNSYIWVGLRVQNAIGQGDTMGNRCLPGRYVIKMGIYEFLD